MLNFKIRPRPQLSGLTEYWATYGHNQRYTLEVSTIDKQVEGLYRDLRKNSKEIFGFSKGSLQTIKGWTYLGVNI